MKITVYTECPTKEYFNSLLYLEKQGKVKVEFVDSRFLRLLLIKINNHSGIFRFVRKLLTGKSQVIKSEPKWKDICKSFFAPFTLPFKNNFVFLFAPYSSIIHLLLFLKFLNKKMIYMTSWPYWHGKYVHKPRLFGKGRWQSFLKKMPTITISKKAEQETRSIGALSKQIPHSIGMDIFKPVKRSKNKKPVVLYIGRLIEAKGITDILELSKELKDIEFVFAGTGPLSKKMQDYPVKYLGYLKGKKDVALAYNKADIFALNSYATKGWEELYGIVLIEAMATGLAVVSTDCVGPKEIINNGKNGLLIPQKNKSELKKAILKLAKDEKLRTRLGNEAIRTAKKNDVKLLAKEWDDMIKKHFKN